MFRPLGRWINSNLYRQIPIFLVGLTVIYITYFWRLGKLTAGMSPAESAARSASGYLASIWHNPLNAPHKLIQFLIQSTGHHGAYFMRLGSVFFVLLFATCFYLLMKHWFGKVFGIFGTLLLIGTTWFINIARSATPSIMLLMPILIMFIYSRLHNSRRPILTWFTLVAVGALAIYIPGLIWFIVGAAVIRRKDLMNELKTLSLRSLGILAALAIVLIIPLVIALIKKPSLINDLILIPNPWPTVLKFLKSLGWSCLAFFWHGSHHTDTLVGRLALFDIVQTPLVIFGVYAMWSKAKKQAYPLILIIIFYTLLSSLNENLILLLPAVLAFCIFATAGLRYLYVEWRGVFPRNPIPKFLALSLMSLIIAMHLVYGWRYSLVAWPHTKAVHQQYVIK